MPIRPVHILTLAAAAIALTGCASDAGPYPSLSIREQERVTGVFDPIEAEPYVPPAPGPETLGRLGKLHADAQAAHTRFLAVAERTRRPASAGRSAAVGSEAWSVAQVALADLTAARSETLIPLADLDLLYIETQTAENDVTEILKIRSEVEAWAAEEDRVVESLSGGAAG